MSNFIKKGSKLYSVLKFKCPHCQEGDFFVSRNPYNLKSMSETHENCSACKRRLSLEPGFYYGAMYISYALGVAHIVSFLIAQYVLGFEMEFWSFILLVGTALALLTPLYYALSKIIWANLFMNFKTDLENEKS